MRATVLLLLTLAACDEGEVDPCEAVDLPVCPEACPDDWTASCGEPCSAPGATCGNPIGDGRSCVDGVWSCVVHAPLAGPDTCHRVCDPEP